MLYVPCSGQRGKRCQILLLGRSTLVWDPKIPPNIRVAMHLNTFQWTLQCYCCHQLVFINAFTFELLLLGQPVILRICSVNDEGVVQKVELGVSRFACRSAGQCNNCVWSPNLLHSPSDSSDIQKPNNSNSFQIMPNDKSNISKTLIFTAPTVLEFPLEILMILDGWKLSRPAIVLLWCHF